MSTSRVKKVAASVSVVLATAALFVPVKLTSDARLEQNDVCGSAACCRESGSICDAGDGIIPDAYSSTVPCKLQH